MQGEDSAGLDLRGGLPSTFAVVPLSATSPVLARLTAPLPPSILTPLVAVIDTSLPLSSSLELAASIMMPPLPSIRILPSLCRVILVST